MDNNQKSDVFNGPVSARILSMEMGNHVADCYSGDEAPCVVACPLNLNIPDFINKVQRGNFQGAYNLFREYAIFPKIVQKLCHKSCESACVRGLIDKPVSLNKLEKAAIDFANKTAPIRYNIPVKKQSVAVVGAGLCGLSCMVRLASHGYPVTVFEKTDRLGGSLWEKLPDRDFLPEIELQTGHLSYVLSTKTAIADLEELKAFDAILLATGAGGEDFGLRHTINLESLGSERPGVFLGGGLLDSDFIQAIENGIRASQSIESYLKTGRMHEMSGVFVKKPSGLKVNMLKFRNVERPVTEEYSKEEAIKEAESCQRCDCDDCLRACDFMQYYKKLPKKIVNDVRVLFNPVEGLQGSYGTRMINSCNACGLCAEVCTENIDMGNFLLDARSIMHREGTLPPVFHDFWLRDMYHAQGEQAYVKQYAPATCNSRYLFFPGCQLGASNPAYVAETYKYLNETLPETGILLTCCGAPLEWAGDNQGMAAAMQRIKADWRDMGEPEIIFACPSCEKMLNKHLPEIRKISIYEMLTRLGMPCERSASSTVSIFDPCSSRYNPNMQDSVRALVAKTGAAIATLSPEGKEAVCCGFGGHIYPANKDLSKRIGEHRAAQSEHPFITYCANCRDLLRQHGKPTAHVLGLIFGLDDFARKAPSLTQRSKNREALKRTIQGCPEDRNMAEKELKIILADGVMEKLDKNLILEDDLRATILHCEETGEKLLNMDTGCFTGHRRLGTVTYWVEYRPAGTAFEVLNSYSHRMQVEGE